MTSHGAQPPIAVGVDVSKSELVLAELFADGTLAHRRVANTMADAEAYIRELVERRFGGRIMIESTVITSGRWC